MEKTTEPDIIENINIDDNEYYKNIIDLVSTVVLTHEMRIYNIINDRYGDNHNVKLNILTVDNDLVFKIIATSTEYYYNKLFSDIEKNLDTDAIKIVMRLIKLSGYTSDVILDKLFRLTLDVNIELARDKLCIDTYETYKKSVWNEIINFFSQRDIMDLVKIDPKKNIDKLIVTDGKVFSATILDNK